MTTFITATVSKIKIKLVDELTNQKSRAMVTVNLSAVFFDGSTDTLPDTTYLFPVPTQTLDDGTILPGCDAFVTLGAPTDDELLASCKVLADYWLGSTGRLNPGNTTVTLVKAG